MSSKKRPAAAAAAAGVKEKPAAAAASDAARKEDAMDERKEGPAAAAAAAADDGDVDQPDAKRARRGRPAAAAAGVAAPAAAAAANAVAVQQSSRNVAAAIAAPAAAAPAAAAAGEAAAPAASVTHAWQVGKLTEAQAASKLSADNYYGQRHESGLPHGLGARLSPAGTVIDEQCGQWVHGKFDEKGWVEREHMPADAPITEEQRGLSSFAASPCVCFVSFTCSPTLALVPSAVAAGAVSMNYDGRFYVGPVSGPQRLANGNGKFFYADGSEWLSGTFVDGLMHGAGKWVYEDGRVYQGSFVRDEYEGIGRMSWPNGNCYEGEWRADMMHGCGTYMHASGQITAGQFVDDIIEGFAVRWDKDGEVITCGKWLCDELVEECAVPRRFLPRECKYLTAAMKRAGPNILLLPDGGFYVGPINAAYKPHGVGKTFHSDGRDQASGTFVDGQLHGVGKWIYEDGSVCEGAFVRGLSEGVARMTDPGGDSYDGEWKADKYHGSGTYINTSGNVLAGQWVDDQTDGFAVEWDKDGKVLRCGKWKADKFIGSCPVPRRFLPRECKHLTPAMKAAGDDILLLPDDGYYVGQTNVMHKPHGEGRTFYANGGDALKGTFVDGQLHGAGKSINQDGSRYEGNFVRGKRERIGRMAWTNGQSYDGVWRQNEMHGCGTRVSPSGGIVAGEFVDGETEGFAVEWDKDKQLLKCGKWQADALVKLHPVPLSLLPKDENQQVPLTPTQRAATLLFPDGSCYCGEINVLNEPDGEGVMQSAGGDMLQRGAWREGQFISLASAEGCAAGAAPAKRDAFSIDCVVCKEVQRDCRLPCGHVAVCKKKCAVKLQVCPICRKAIDHSKIIDVFLP